MHDSPLRTSRTHRARALGLAIGLACALGATLALPSDVAAADTPRGPVAIAITPGERALLAPSTTAQLPWAWPLAGRRVIARPFLAPPHAYGPGHRGIDLRVDEGESVSVFAPADGVVAFVGVIADRPLLTIDHGNGLVSTLEPVEGTLEQGQHVRRGDIVGQLATGGHTRAGTVHLGARLDGNYVNPLRFLGGIPRARLLPLD